MTVLLTIKNIKATDNFAFFDVGIENMIVLTIDKQLEKLKNSRYELSKRPEYNIK